MQSTKQTNQSIDNLIYLPAFASYLLNNKLQELVEMQLRICKEINLPLLRRLKDYSHSEQTKLAKQKIADFLNFLSKNRGQEHIYESLQNWKTDQLPLIAKDDLAADNLTRLTYMCKKSFLYFLPDYCSDTHQVIELVKEIDLFLLEIETSALNFFMDLLQNRIKQHTHFIEKVTNTLPGMIYVFDVINNKELYANKPSSDFLRFEPQEQPQLKNFGETCIHPDDIQMLRQYEEDFKKSKDGEIRSIKYRLRNRAHEYRWIRTFETIFKRNENGEVSEKIGVAIDVHQQHITAEQLKKREGELLEAQEIARLGSFIWDFNGGISQGSPQVDKILGVGFGNHELFMHHVHPDDRQKVEEAIQLALQTGAYECEYRYTHPHGKEKFIWTKGLINYTGNKPVSMHGTLMDITDRQQLVNDLKQKESLHQQAEALTHIGNFVWDLTTGFISWSDELFRIYNLEPQSVKITLELVDELHHPDDRKQIQTVVQSCLASKQEQNFDLRIRTRDSKKIVHVRGSLQPGKPGEPVSVIGTVQDITENELLLEKLKKSEKIYRQAEELSNMGNWNWNIQTNKLEWTNQLYKIYGLEPQSEEITIERFLSFVHPKDRDHVEAGIDQFKEQNTLDDTFSIIAADGKEKTIRSIAHVEYDENGKPAFVIGTERDITEKQILIDRLKKSESLFKQAQDIAKIGNWSWEISTDKIEWSEGIYKIYELPENTELTYDKVAGYVHPDDKESVEADLEECLQKGIPYERHHRIVMKDGRIKIIHRRAEVIYENGKPFKIVGTTQDITEMYQVQQELKENQNFIRKITDATPSIITSYNVNTGKYVFISEGVEKLLGYSTKEVMENGYTYLIDKVHPDDVAELLQKDNKAITEANENPSSEPVVEHTFRIQHKNGSYRWLHTYGTVFDRNSEGKIEHVLNISLDVTDQKKATEKIAEQEHFIQQIADASPTILYLYDVDTQSIVYINREIFFVLGYLPDEIVETGTAVTEMLYHPDDYPLLPARKQSNKNFQQVDSMMQYECRMKGKDDEWRWFLVREIVFKTSENGEIKQILGAALDISRRKTMERTILQNTLQLEQSNASLEEFAYVASHDLKEPLRKISTFGDRLVATHMDKLTLDGKLYLKKIVDASQRMQTMITDLLSISMITGNRSFEPFSLQKILEETLQTLEFKIEQQNAVIEASELPEANIIPAQFRQLFQNLISNSLKFVQENVQPVLQIKYSRAAENETAHFQMSPAAYYHKIEFSDNGIGFEMEFANKIFAIFQRLHGRSEYEGSGIGLAICKKIVEHHGGIIYAKGIPGVGATFTIILPA